EDLLVAARVHAPLARVEQLAPRALEQRLRVVAAERRGGLDDLQVPGFAASVRVLEVRLAIEAGDALRDRGLLRRQDSIELVGREHVEAAFAAGRVRVERRVER